MVWTQSTEHIFGDQRQEVVILEQLVLVAGVVGLDPGQVQLGEVGHVKLLLYLVDQQVMVSALDHGAPIALIDQLVLLAPCPQHTAWPQVPSAFCNNGKLTL